MKGKGKKVYGSTRVYKVGERTVNIEVKEWASWCDTATVQPVHSENYVIFKTALVLRLCCM